MGWIEEKLKDSNVKGIIVAGKYDERLYYAQRMLKNIEVFLYEVNFKLNEYRRKKSMKRLFLKPFKKLSSGRRLNLKRVIFFPLIVYTAYVFIDSFMPLFMVGFVIWLMYSWTGKKRFW